ncbi:DUF423 domain-containing protein [Azospirillum sp. sgz302134]
MAPAGMGPVGMGPVGMGLVDRIWMAFAALNGAVAVGAGAYASHGLAGDPRAQELFRLAGQYQMWHALALVALVAFARRAGGPARVALRLAGWLFVAGIVLFSGTLYALATIGPLPVRATAPMGGTAFMLGWVMVAGAALLFGRRFFEEG